MYDPNDGEWRIEGELGSLLLSAAAEAAGMIPPQGLEDRVRATNVDAGRGFARRSVAKMLAKGNITPEQARALRTYIG